MKEKKEGRHKSRHTTLYDALEDRIKKRHATGFIRAEDETLPSSLNHQRGPQSRYAAHPSVVLASRLGIDVSQVPEPPCDLELPRSDLLNAIHGYASSILTQSTEEDTLEKSIYATDLDMAPFMDETALLAFGVIVEEITRDLIGERGHLVLAEESGLSAMTEDLSASHLQAGSIKVQEFKNLDATETSEVPQAESSKDHVRNDTPARLYQSTANFPPFDLDPQSLHLKK